MIGAPTKLFINFTKFYKPFYPVFSAMEKEGLVLNLHGECPSDHAKDITVLNAESSFLPTLKSLHAKFPALKIVLEHCTTRAAVEAVTECGPTVVGTITPHHLFITIDDWADDPFCYCKPVAKYPSKSPYVFPYWIIQDHQSQSRGGEFHSQVLY